MRALKMSGIRAVLGGVAMMATLGAVQPAWAVTQEYVAGINGTFSGTTVNASTVIMFDPATGAMNVTLTNNMNSSIGIAQSISGLVVNMSSGTVGYSAGSLTQAGQLYAFTGGSSPYSTPGYVSGDPTHWAIGATAANQFTLATLGPVASGKPVNLITGSSLSGGPGQGSHDPSILKTGQFAFNMTGATLGMTVASVQFWFGTSANGGDFETPTTVTTTTTVTAPEPASLAVLASALAGLGVLRRRRRR